MTTDNTTATRIINATDTGLLVYIDADTGMCAGITIDGLRLAHNADLAVGCHPYARATTWIAEALQPVLAPAMVNPADAAMVDDWIEWCDDVFARYAELSGEESIASSAQQTGCISDARFADEVNLALAREELAEVAATLPTLAAVRETTRHARSMARHAADLGGRIGLSN